MRFDLSPSIHKFDDIFILTEKTVLLTKMTMAIPFLLHEHKGMRIETLKGHWCNRPFMERHHYQRIEAIISNLWMLAVAIERSKGY